MEQRHRQLRDLVLIEPFTEATVPHRLAIVIVAAILAGALLVGCSVSGSSSGTPRCTKPPRGIGPDADATLEDRNANGRWCLSTGQVLTVFLHAPVDEERWGAIRPNPDGVLIARSTGVMTLPLGVSAGVFVARTPGTVTLRSVRLPCAPPAAEGCDAAHRWTATVVVR